MENSIRRIVTGHNEKGEAVFSADDLFIPMVIPTGDAAMSTLYTTVKVPADCNDETDGHLRDAGTTLKGGSVLRIVDMLPGASSPMHRSSSIDYGVVLSGQIDLELDNGVIKRIGPHGVIVQRGSIHKWINPSDKEICRILFVLIEAHPYKVAGKPLPDVMEH